jgi:hypothetical protein
VSGVIDRPKERQGEVRAALRVSRAGGIDGRLRLRWHEGGKAPTALISGSLGETKVRARSPAP